MEERAGGDEATGDEEWATSGLFWVRQPRRACKLLGLGSPVGHGLGIALGGPTAGGLGLSGKEGTTKASKARHRAER